MNDKQTKLKKRISDLLLEAQMYAQERARRQSEERQALRREWDCLLQAQQLLAGQILPEQLKLFG